MKLAEARGRKLLTGRELAERAGVSHTNIYAIEAGRWLPSLPTIRKLCEALEVQNPLDIDEFKAAIEKTTQGKKEPARA